MNLREKYGVKILVIRADFADPNLIENIFEQTKDLGIHLVN